MEAASEVDIIILLSGDGDFDLLLKKVMQRDGVTTHVYGVTALTAQSLINAANEFFPIDRSLLL